MPEEGSDFGAAYASAKGRLEREIASRPEDPTPRLELAQLAYIEGDLSTAERQLRQVLGLPKASPMERARAQLRLGDVLSEQDKLEEALQAYRKACELAAGSPLAEEARLEAELAELELDVVYRPLKEAESAVAGRIPSCDELNRLGCLQILAGRIEDAAESFLRAISLAPGSLQAVLNFGFVQCLASAEPSRLRRSVKELVAALERFPSEARLYLHLAELYEASSLYEAAISRIGDALDVAPWCMEAYDLAARYAFLGAECTLPLRKKIDALVAKAEEELKRSSGDFKAKKNLALILIGSARYRRAAPEEYKRPCELLEEVVAHDDDEEVGFRIAECRERMGDLGAAERILRAVLERSPQSYRPPFELGGFLLRRGRPVEAVDLFRKAVAIAPQEATLYQSLRFALMSAKKLRLEEFAARAELALSPSSPDAYLRLGRAYLEALRTEQALEVLQKAAMLAPGRADVHTELARALERLGRQDEAEGALRRAIAADPAYAEAYKILGRILLERGGRTREGLEALQTYRKLSRGRRERPERAGESDPT